MDMDMDTERRAGGLDPELYLTCRGVWGRGGSIEEAVERLSQPPRPPPPLFLLGSALPSWLAGKRPAASQAGRARVVPASASKGSWRREIDHRLHGSIRGVHGASLQQLTCQKLCHQYNCKLTTDPDLHRSQGINYSQKKGHRLARLIPGMKFVLPLFLYTKDISLLKVNFD